MGEGGLVFPTGAEPETAPHLSLTGFEGPLDLLLDLARAQKVDLAQISILQLVEQYLAFVEGARQIRLELAADWLVMAAWLTWLKSRLLLPAENEPDGEAEEAAELLQGRLLELEAIRGLSRWLDNRPRLGEHVFARGCGESMTQIDRSGLRVDMIGLITAYLAMTRRRGRKRFYAPPRPRYWTVTEAVSALQRLLNASEVAGWQKLTALLPAQESTAPRARAAALASALVAGLEMAKSGAVELKQEGIFAEIMLRAPQKDDVFEKASAGQVSEKDET
ncbi:segregation/condensation protein A [Asaia siamensis]|uniref:Segregation and condensation protein A n=1 Tax=Asaia siamensis TaxID=110479 RepID=A0ABQ1LW07_9PROT|nr:ScpA family protein [Asaia siamensis]GBR04198.1 chromosome segregation and condensation protein ScpA [Asaia siamensis NRIC 0323]GGC28600.1 segregation/condensation protein A [Asaia siamensis]